METTIVYWGYIVWGVPIVGIVAPFYADSDLGFHCIVCSVGLRMYGWKSIGNSRPEATWTPKVCRIMAFWAIFIGFGQFVLPTLGV